MGHLAIAADFVPLVLGLPVLLPRNWSVLFGPGSDPHKYLEKHPERAALIAAYDAGHAYVEKILLEVEPEKLKQPSPFEPLLQHLPTT
ncbi:MAG TPA: hypothetical protein PKA06_16405, partial [Gemmatales bacterium]|nr:hypothetical protein [Gemmatales bacterium]